MRGGVTMFISSTVRDFAAIRQDLASYYGDRQIGVLLSENPDFPVKPGVTSHDACLAQVRQAHVFVLLIGRRFGGEYQNQNKSITWREWEEALNAQLSPIVLIHKDADALALELFEHRRRMMKAHPGWSLSKVEQKLALVGSFRDRKPRVQRFPAVQRFIEAVRKGHKDNWIHVWDGSAKSATKLINRRLHDMFISYQQDRHIVYRQYLNLAAVAFLIRHASIYASQIARRGRPNPLEAVRALLFLSEHKRGDLFGFQPNDLYHFVLYRRHRTSLVPCVCVHDPRIQPRNRAWRLGQSHVGEAVRRKQILVSGDIRQGELWVTQPHYEQQDRQNYVSSVTVPLYLQGKDPETALPDAALTITSNRTDHFRDNDQPEVLTVEALGRILSSVWCMER